MPPCFATVISENASLGVLYEFKPAGRLRERRRRPLRLVETKQRSMLSLQSAEAIVKKLSAVTHHLPFRRGRL